MPWRRTLVGSPFHIAGPSRRRHVVCHFPLRQLATGGGLPVGRPELFFPVSSSGRSLELQERAKAVCRTCIVRRQCLAYAIAANEEGVWGGMTEEERLRVAHRTRAWAEPAASGAEPAFRPPWTHDGYG
jgi:Transcription factor WhiB